MSLDPIRTGLTAGHDPMTACSIRPFIHLLVLSAVADAVACDRVPVEGYCCTTQEACDRPRGSGAITPCPAGQWCDNEGEYGEPGRSCIATPAGRCTTAADCPAELPACNAETFTCERCGSDAACAGTASPRCDLGSGTCVACLGAGDCASEVCDEGTRTCVDPATVIYVATDGVATGACTQAQPCNTIQLGVSQVSAGRALIKVRAGTYAEQVTLSGVTATITGDGAVVAPSGIPGLVVQDGAQVTLEGVRVTGVQGAANPPGIRCHIVASGVPSLRLRRVTVDKNSIGIAATGCALTIEQSTIVGNVGGVGVAAAADCVLTIERSTIGGNTGGGVNISGGTFVLTNNMIVANGSPTSTFGGVSIGQISSGTPLRFDFNTVTANGGAPGARTGVDCAQVLVPLTFSNNIVYGNQVAGTGSQIGGNNCSYAYSDIGPQAAAGTGNVNVDPLFVDPMNANYHLQAGSPARDAAAPAATLTVDIDGDRRPQGGRSDMGADEVME